MVGEGCKAHILLVILVDRRHNDSRVRQSSATSLPLLFFASSSGPHLRPLDRSSVPTVTLSLQCLQGRNPRAGPDAEQKSPPETFNAHAHPPTPGPLSCPPPVFQHPPTEWQRQGWSLYLRGIIRIKLAPWTAGPGGRADRGWGTEVLLTVRGLGPQVGSKLHVIITDVWALGPWLQDLGPGHPCLGLR